MSGLIDNSQLSVELQEKKKDYEKIFALKVRDGFGDAKKHLTPMGIDQKVGLKREFMSNITQPGRTGAVNPPTEFLKWKERIPKLEPAKVDLFLDEIALYKLRMSFLSQREPADVSDIHSMAGRNYIMGRVFKQIGKEVMGAIFKSVVGFQGSGNTTAWQGGLNLFDGLGIKFDLGYAAAGSVAGAVGDIPVGNKVANPASTFTESNALAELRKMLDMVYDTPELHDIAISDDPEDENYLHLPASYFKAMQMALDNLPYKSNQLVEVSSGNIYQFKALPGMKIKQCSFLNGVDNMFWSPKSNLFWLHPLAGQDVTSIKFQEKDRGLQILLDWENDADYADGRQITLYK